VARHDLKERDPVVSPPRSRARRLAGWAAAVFASACVCLALLLAACHHWIGSTTNDRIYGSVAAIPAREFALVLGTNPMVADGRPNLFFTRRIDAAEELFRHRKASRLILSGGTDGGAYDEPEQMRQALLARGVPDDALLLDRAGYRTLDSVVRARKVFGATEITVISQTFHNERAIFIADRRGVDAIGFAAEDVGGLGGMRVNLRETLARVRALLDLYITHEQPASLQ
jgi:SanA protein